MDEIRVKAAKRYSNIKYALALLDLAGLLAAILLFLGLGFSKVLAAGLRSFAGRGFLLVAVYVLVVSLLYYIITFPLHFYQSYLLEQRFSLSRESLGSWFRDQLKSGIISYIISLVLFSVFYSVVEHYPLGWWWVVWVFWIFSSVVLAKLVPLVIIPLFFKYKKLSDENLRERIIKLAAKLQVKIIEVFEIDFSKKTSKANAAFVGIGNTRRVLLADTLTQKYTHDEIEVILAHEFAHYKLGHLWKLVLVNSFVTLAAFYCIYKTSPVLLGHLGLESISDIAAMPLILLYFTAVSLILQPLQNYISRVFERQADKMAIESTGLKDAFISSMEKLASQNLADQTPHPLIKFFFFDHPPIAERIHCARAISS